VIRAGSKAVFRIELLFTGKSQETPQLAVGRNGKRGFGGGSPDYGFFLGISPGHIARTSSRNKMKNFRFEAPGRFIDQGYKRALSLVNPFMKRWHRASQCFVGFEGFDRKLIQLLIKFGISFKLFPLIHNLTQ